MDIKKILIANQRILKRIFYCFSIIIFVILIISTLKKGGDLQVYLYAAKHLTLGSNVYQPPFFGGLPYYYSPLFATLLIPFSNIFYVVGTIWLMLLAILYIRIIDIMRRELSIDLLPTLEQNLWLMLTIFVSLKLFLYNIWALQITVFLVWSFLESLQLLKKDKIVLPSALIALAINIKIIPIIILPYLLITKNYKAFAISIIFVVITLFIPAIFLGIDYNIFLHQEWWKVIDPSNNKYLLELGKETQSLIAIVPVYFSQTTGDSPTARNILNLPISTSIFITSIIRLFFVAATLIIFYKAKKVWTKLSEIWVVAYILAITPLVFPNQQRYAFFYAMPAIAYLIHFAIITKLQLPTAYKIILLTFGLIGFLLVSPLLLKQTIGAVAYLEYFHFRLLGIGTLLIAISMFFAGPKDIR